jgi:hypothetical protein
MLLLMYLIQSTKINIYIKTGRKIRSEGNGPNEEVEQVQQEKKDTYLFA